MADFSIIAPLIALLASVDVLVHIYSDVKKVRSHSVHATTDTGVSVPGGALIATAVITLLSFLIVLVIPVDWFITGGQTIEILLVMPTPPPLITWIGFMFLVIGIVLHGWSRWVRHGMASSWTMRDSHRLVTHGPYSRIRHPSYSSYMWSFVGLLLLVPSILTVPLVIGIPGYYIIAKVEEEHLVRHFGEEYKVYKKRTGMFLPKIT